jgi:hypothetical protein
MPNTIAMKPLTKARPTKAKAAATAPSKPAPSEPQELITETSDFAIGEPCISSSIRTSRRQRRGGFSCLRLRALICHRIFWKRRARTARNTVRLFHRPRYLSQPDFNLSVAEGHRIRITLRPRASRVSHIRPLAGLPSAPGTEIQARNFSPRLTEDPATGKCHCSGSGDARRNFGLIWAGPTCWWREFSSMLVRRAQCMSADAASTSSRGPFIRLRQPESRARSCAATGCCVS